MSVDFDLMDFFTGGALIILDYGLLAKSDDLKLKNALMVDFYSYKHTAFHFTSC